MLSRRKISVKIPKNDPRKVKSRQTWKFKPERLLGMKTIGIINNGHNPNFSIIIRDYQHQCSTKDCYWHNHDNSFFFSKTPWCRQKIHLQQSLPTPNHVEFSIVDDQGVLNRLWFPLSKEEWELKLLIKWMIWRTIFLFESLCSSSK